MRNNHYFAGWAIAATLSLIFVVLLNAFVDPYAIIGSPRIEGVNAIKPTAANRSTSVKPYQVARANAATLIVGNSRPEMGIDPAHVCLAGESPAYSLTLPGSSVYQQVRYAEHAFAHRVPVRLLVGVDLVDFLNVRGREPELDPSAWPRPPLGFDGRLSVNSDGTPNSRQYLARMRDYRDALLSFSALEDSVHTLLAQHASLATDRTPTGFNPARDYRAIVHAEGQSILFRQKNAELAERLNKHAWRLYPDEADWSVEFESLERLLMKAQESGSAVNVFINPYHADYLTMIALSGYWDLFEQWKIALVSLIERFENARLWDFSAYSPYATHPPPAPSDRSSTDAWFWEPSHYRAELGNLMLAQMFAETGCSDAVEPPVGRALSVDNVMAWLARQRTERDRYFSEQPDEVKRVKAFF